MEQPLPISLIDVDAELHRVQILHATFLHEHFFGCVIFNLRFQHIFEAHLSAFDDIIFLCRFIENILKILNVAEHFVAFFDWYDGSISFLCASNSNYFFIGREKVADDRFCC